MKKTKLQKKSLSYYLCFNVQQSQVADKCLDVCKKKSTKDAHTAGEVIDLVHMTNELNKPVSPATKLALTP